MWVRVPKWLKCLFPQLIWELPATEKIVYLTFDDGPTPDITERVLALLFEYGAKATFFCLGSKAETLPELIEKIKSGGHTVGSHGYYHLNGFYTPSSSYLENARHGIRIINSKLYRPPYGKITSYQVRKLKPSVDIVMWSIMSMDFDTRLSPEKCLNNVIRNLYPGAIIVFHDTEKAADKLWYVLPRLLQFLAESGYSAFSLDIP